VAHLEQTSFVKIQLSHR